MTDERHLATELLVVAARGISKSMSDALRPHGLAPAQFGILDLLDREGTLYPSTMSIPRVCGHRIHEHVATDSTMMWPPVPRHVATPLR